MQIYEITQIYGTGPFGRAGVTQVFVSPTIKGWLDLYASKKRRYDPEGVIHDLFIMSPNIWRSQRRLGRLPYSSPRIMDRLEIVTAQIDDPQIRLFTGVFPRLKGQPCSQILWWKPLPPGCVLIGVEEDLPGLRAPLTRHESAEPSAYPHDSWVGIGGLSIDWGCGTEQLHPVR